MSKINDSPIRVIERVASPPPTAESHPLGDRQVERLAVKAKKIDIKKIDKEIYRQSLLNQTEYMRGKQLRILSKKNPAAREKISELIQVALINSHRLIKDAAAGLSDYKRFRAFKLDVGQMATRKAQAKSAAMTDAKHADFTDMGSAEKEAVRCYSDMLPLSYKGVDRPPYNYSLPEGYSLCNESEVPEILAMFYDDQTGIISTPSGFKALLMKSDDDIVLAFAGTETGKKAETDRTHSMQADIVQRIGGYSTMYHDAAGITHMLLEHHPEKPFKLVGHSLGGGLAQYALATNIESESNRLQGWTFNSAGLSASTLGAIGVERIKAAQQNITNVRVEGDPVSAGSSMGEKFKGALLGKVWTLKREGASSMSYEAHKNDFLRREIKKEMDSTATE